MVLLTVKRTRRIHYSYRMYYESIYGSILTYSRVTGLGVLV